jgi:hypothetical protein
MLADARIVDGQITTLQLQKIKVPQNSDRRVTFQVFWDFTNSTMRDKYARTTWEAGPFAYDADRICFDRYDRIPGGFLFCSAWLSNNPERFAQDVFTWDAYGNLNALSFIQPPPQFQRRNFGRVVVNNVTDDDFVAVFPGVYGVHFTSSDGRQDDVYGVVVE